MKDIERTSGVLQARFLHFMGAYSFLGQGCLGKYHDCVILLNMIIKVESDMPRHIDYENIGTIFRPHRHTSISRGMPKN